MFFYIFETENCDFCKNWRFCDFTAKNILLWFPVNYYLTKKFGQKRPRWWKWPRVSFLAKIISFYCGWQNCGFSVKIVFHRLRVKIRHFQDTRMIFLIDFFSSILIEKLQIFGKKQSPQKYRKIARNAGPKSTKVYHLNFRFRRFGAKFGRVEIKKKSGNFKISLLGIWYKLL